MSIARAVVLAWAWALAVMPQALATELRISHQWAAQTDGRDRAARVLIAEAAKLAPDLKISIHPSLALGSTAIGQLDSMLEGKFEMTIFPMFYASPRLPELSISLLPGLPASVEQAQLLKGSDFHRRLQAFCEHNGFHILTWWWSTGGMVSTGAEIGGPEEFSGARVRTGDPMFDVMFKSLGAEPQMMATNDVGRAMKEGRLDVALAALDAMISLRMQEFVKSAVIGGRSLYVGFIPLLISNTAWQSLTPEQRAALEKAAEIADRAYVAGQKDTLVEALLTYNRGGVKIRSMSEDEYVRWITLAHETSWQEYEAKSPEAGALLTSMLQSFIDSDQKNAQR